MIDSPNHLYFGDNLDILRQHIADESVDLIYLDPPFNSNAGSVCLWCMPVLLSVAVTTFLHISDVVCLCGLAVRVARCAPEWLCVGSVSLPNA